MIDGRIFFGKPIKNGLKRYDNIRKIAMSQGDDSTTGYLLDYPYFKKYYKLIVIVISDNTDIEKHYNKLILLEI